MVSDQSGRIKDSMQVSRLSTAENAAAQSEKGIARWAELIPILKKLITSFLE